MFYSDDTIHKIYADEGSFDFTYQLPQMCYSFIISYVIKTIFNIFGLYEDKIWSFKNDKETNINPKKELNELKCRVFFFFIISYITLFFLWIYLGCFCAVYKNTQIHLLINVISSFCLSFITPFFVYLIPGFFRIRALKSEDKSPLLFKFSKLLQLF